MSSLGKVQQKLVVIVGAGGPLRCLGKSIAVALGRDLVASVQRAIVERQPPFWAEDWRNAERRKNSNNRSRKNRKY